MSQRGRALLVGIGIAFGMAIGIDAHAHDGPPYLIAVDELIPGGGLLSVWADPDVGVGTFYAYIEPESEAGRVSLHLSVRPGDGHAAEASFAASAAEAGSPYQKLLLADFDRPGIWSATLSIEASGRRRDVPLSLEVTPAGLGRLDLIIYLFPFVGVALLWARAMHARRRPAPARA